MYLQAADAATRCRGGLGLCDYFVFQLAKGEWVLHLSTR